MFILPFGTLSHVKCYQPEELILNIYESCLLKEKFFNAK